MSDKVIEDRERYTRRRFLTAGAAVMALAPAEVDAANGDALKAGQVLQATSETGVEKSDDSLKDVFLADDIHPDPSIVLRVGVFGFSNSTGEMGVCGRAGHANARGVGGFNLLGGNGVFG